MPKSYSTLRANASLAAINFVEEAGRIVNDRTHKQMASLRGNGANDRDLLHAVTIQILLNALRDAVKAHNVKGSHQLPMFKVIKQGRKKNATAD